MLYAIVALIAIILDQAVKYWTSAHIVLDSGMKELIPGFIHLTNLHNTGAAFSFLEGARWFFVILCVIFTVAIIFLLAKKIIKAPVARWMLIIVLAGAIGNCIDRIFCGYVVDMLEFDFLIFGKSFPVFNVADMYITLGGILFCLCILFEKDALGNSTPEKNAVPAKAAPTQSGKAAPNAAPPKAAPVKTTAPAPAKAAEPVPAKVAKPAPEKVAKPVSEKADELAAETKAESIPVKSAAEKTPVAPLSHAASTDADVSSAHSEPSPSERPARTAAKAVGSHAPGRRRTKTEIPTFPKREPVPQPKIDPNDPFAEWERALSADGAHSAPSGDSAPAAASTVTPQSAPVEPAVRATVQPTPSRAEPVTPAAPPAPASEESASSAPSVEDTDRAAVPPVQPVYDSGDDSEGNYDLDDILAEFKDL